MHTLRSDRSGNDTLTRAKASCDSLGKFKAENFKSIKGKKKYSVNFIHLIFKEFVLLVFCAIWFYTCFVLRRQLVSMLFGLGFGPKYESEVHFGQVVPRLLLCPLPGPG